MRIIVIGDLHGDIGMLCSCLYMAKIINSDMEWIADPPNTHVVQIGDQVDSLVRDVETGWEKLDDTMLIRFTDKLDAIAKEKGGRFISLLGNHELMNATGNFMYVSENSMEKSGGYLGRISKFKPGGVYAKLLAKRPVVLKLDNILFCHAGIIPEHLKAVGNEIQTFNLLVEKFLMGDKPLTPIEAIAIEKLFLGEHSMLWNRHYLLKDGAEALKYVLENTQTNAMVIGHNPLPNITPMYNNHLWVTDVGLSRSFSNNTLQVLEILDGREFRVIQAVKK